MAESQKASKGFGRSRGRSAGRARGMLNLLAESSKAKAERERSRSRSSASSASSPTRSVDSPSRSPSGSPSQRGGGRERGGFRRPDGVLVTKPRAVKNKVGDKGREITLLANYFKLQYPTDIIINQYHVEFEPSVESAGMRRKLMMKNKEAFGQTFLFDGMSNLKTMNSLEDSDLKFVQQRETDGVDIAITLKHTGQVSWGAMEMIRMYNTQMRRNLIHLGYTLLGRFYYDKNTEVRISEHGGIGIWRGFLTAVGQHDGGILMACDTIYKFIRGQTALEILKGVLEKVGKDGFQETARRELGGCTVMTRYNNKTYRVDDVTFDKNPQYVFDRKGGSISLIDYYKEQYNIDIRDPKQPLIECLPSSRDKRAGRTEKVLLIPELCLMTGLTDEMRANFKLCKQIDEVSKLTPVKRVENLKSFMGDLRGNANVRTEMSNWKIGFAVGLTEITARQLEGEKIIMSDGSDGGELYEQNKGDFTRQIRGKKMPHPVSIGRWAVIFSPRDRSLVNDFASTLNKVCAPMGVNLGKPKMMPLENDKTSSYINTLKSLPSGAEIVVCVVPNNNKDRYDSIKKLCCCDKPVASQVVVSRTISKPQMLMSVCTKIGIQMSVKLGAEAWAVHIPPKNMMVVGYDTYHDGTMKGQSAGGFVSSLNQTLTRWFSTIAYHRNQQEMSGNFANNFKEAIKRYQTTNSTIPDRIVVYRDGVGEGLIPHVYDYELKQIKKAIKEISGECVPKLVFIIVTKRLNAKFFKKAGEGIENPPPGTVVDTVVTLPQRYDFYLISQSVRQGTVAPTMFNIIEDESNWKPHNHQQLAYKLTHLYYNWPGTIRVPAPCQYAHKLAYLTGTCLHKEPNNTLCNTLFYL